MIGRQLQKYKPWSLLTARVYNRKGRRLSYSTIVPETAVVRGHTRLHRKNAHQRRYRLCAVFVAKTVKSRDTVRLWAGPSNSVMRLLLTDLDDGDREKSCVVPSKNVDIPAGFYRPLSMEIPYPYCLQSVCLLITEPVSLPRRILIIIFRDCARDMRSQFFFFCMRNNNLATHNAYTKKYKEVFWRN